MKSFDEMQVGDEFESHGRTLTETDIVNFVGMAGIKLPIFVDEEFCNKHSPFKTRIAPGFLVLALTAGMIEDIIGQAIAALSLDKIKFSTVVKPGDTLRARTRIEAKRNTSDGKRGILTIVPRVYNQRGELVLEFVNTLMMRRSQ